VTAGWRRAGAHAVDDGLARIHQRAVEVEQDEAEAHGGIVAAGRAERPGTVVRGAARRAPLAE
jgi:hypothetical protein